ncbi:MAG: hypothetical protein ACHQK9_14785, partial [Reyranellales bacterium]
QRLLYLLKRNVPAQRFQRHAIHFDGRSAYSDGPSLADNREHTSLLAIAVNNSAIGNVRLVLCALTEPYWLAEPSVYAPQWRFRRNRPTFANKDDHTCRALRNFRDGGAF